MHIVSQYILHKHIWVTITLSIMYIAAQHIIAPKLVITDQDGRSHISRSLFYDQRMLHTIRNNQFALKQTLPDPVPHRYMYQKTTPRKELEQTLSHIRTYIHNQQHKALDALATRIKDDNFDYQSGTGMLILKLKHQPFLIKFFRESIHTITSSHGFEPYFFMLMNGGMNRHTAGLTRITTNDRLAQFLHTHRSQYPNITTPRVWAWLPDDTSWLTLTLHHNNKHEYACIPSEYALINDCITYDPEHNAPRSYVFSLFCDTDNLFDPHEGNCVYEIPTDQYVILDTEAFMDMTGANRPLYTHSYVRWYTNLITRCLLRILFPHIRQM